MAADDADPWDDPDEASVATERLNSLLANGDVSRREGR